MFTDMDCEFHVTDVFCDLHKSSYCYEILNVYDIHVCEQIFII